MEYMDLIQFNLLFHEKQLKLQLQNTIFQHYYI